MPSGARKAKRVVLLIRDGWGESDTEKGNAIAQAHTPHTDRLMSSYYVAHLSASGETVGLPKDDMGNSEVGHLTMGAGRSSPQELMRIQQSIASHAYADLPPLKEAIERSVRSGKAKLHLIGLLSDGGVHSHIDHLLHTLHCIKQALHSSDSSDSSPPAVYIHAITDGRDTPPHSAYTYIQQLHEFTSKEQIGQLATLVGRHYAMDRDHRWDRVQAAYDLFVHGKGEEVKEDDIDAKLKELYDQGKEDQTLPPLLVNKEGVVGDKDDIFFFNFRNDRMKELCGAMLGKEKEIKHAPSFHPHITSMVQYDEAFTDVPVLFPFHPVHHSLPEVLSAANLTQFHCAETEKYAHVTFFFSGGKDQAVKGEDRKLIPSPHVNTYDQQPAMSCAGVANALMAALKSDKYDFLICNLAAADMVAHTGKMEATVKACEAVDEAVGKVAEVVEGMEGTVMLVTGDHGNAEEMLDEKGGVKTAHTTNLVPCIVVGKGYERKGGGGKERGGKQGDEEEEGKGGNEEGGAKEGKDEGGEGEGKGKAGKEKPRKKRKVEVSTERGGLDDVAPTILELLGVEQPKEMTGKSLLPK